MAFILPIEEPWTSQPQGAVGIDWSNPRTKGIVFCHSAPKVYDEFVRVLSGVTVAGPGVITTSKVGLVRQLSSSVAQKFGTVGNIGFVQQASILVLFQRTATLGSYARLFDTRQAGSGIAYFLNSGGAGQNAVRLMSTTSITDHDISGTFSDTSKPTIGIVTIANGDVSLYEGATRIANSTTSGGDLIQTTTNSFLNGSENAASVVSPFNGWIALTVLWNRRLTPSEVATLGVNPWQIFAP